MVKDVITGMVLAMKIIEKKKIIDEAKIKEIINDDMLIDANALVRGAIETTRGGKITESDCAGAINYLGSLGMLTD